MSYVERKRVPQTDPIREYSPSYATLCNESSAGIGSVKYLKVIDLNPLPHITSVVALFSGVEGSGVT